MCMLAGMGGPALCLACLKQSIFNAVYYFPSLSVTLSLYHSISFLSSTSPFHYASLVERKHDSNGIELFHTSFVVDVVLSIGLEAILIVVKMD